MNKSTVVFGTVLWAASGFAGVTVGYHEYGGVDVPSDEQTLSEDVLVGDGGHFSKTGAGKLTVPLSRVNRMTDKWELRALEGTLRVEPGEDATATSVPTVIAAKAALWLNADSAVTTNGTDGTAYVKKWVDVRDVERPDAPAYVYATPAWGTLAPASSSNKPPVKVTQDGTAALYFGGMTSGKYMALSQKISMIRQQFVVHGVYDCWGAVIGCSDTRSGMVPDTFNGSVAATGRSQHFSRRVELSNAYSCGRYHLDGNLFDPYTVSPNLGFQLLECEFPLYGGSFNQIFRSGFETVANKTTDKKVQGGDYVSEIIVFTNILSDAERVDVERYLMRKWSLPRAKTDRPQAYLPAQGVVVAATNVAVELTADSDETLPLLDLRGNGTFRKTGAGTLDVGPSEETSPAYTFQWDDGAILSRGGRPPAVRARAGDAFDGAVYTPYTLAESRTPGIDITAGAKLTRTTDAGAGKVAKTGNDWVRVNEVADDVRTIDVREGVFALEAKTRGANAYAVERPVVITNADFELSFVTNATYFRGTLNKNAQNGWTGTACYIACTNSASLTWFSEKEELRPPLPSGNHVVMLNDSATAKTTVEIPEDGWYEVILRAKERYGTGHNGDLLTYGEVSWGTEGSSLAVAGRIFPSGYGYGRYTVRLPYVRAGRHDLQIKGVMTGRDGTLLVDDVEIRALGRNPEIATFKVPNGDFESIDRRTEVPRYKGRYTLVNVPTGWTFDASESEFPLALTNGCVGVVAPAFSIDGTAGMLFGLWNLLPGINRLYFYDMGGKASTTFRAPAGTYRLRADMARHNCAITPSGEKEKDCEEPLTVKATLTLAGGTVVELGSVRRTSFLAMDCSWPTNFTLDAEQDVTLTLQSTENNGAGWVDNLAFVSAAKYAEEKNLLVCPGGESIDWNGGADWHPSNDRSFFKNSNSGVRGYKGTTTKNYGYAAFEGDNYFFIQSAGTLYQTVQVSAPGLYRFKLHTKTRADSSNYTGNNLRLWYHAAGSTATNHIDTLLMHYTGNFLERAYLVDFPTAGDYEIGITGLGVPSAGAGADRESHLDGLSLKKVKGAVDDVPEMPDDVKIKVAEGARLVLDFPGRKTVRLLKLGERSVPAGVVKASDYPDYLGGIGEVEVKPVGSVILVR